MGKSILLRFSSRSACVHGTRNTLRLPSYKKQWSTPSRIEAALRCIRAVYGGNCKNGARLVARLSLLQRANHNYSSYHDPTTNFTAAHLSLTRYGVGRQRADARGL